MERALASDYFAGLDVDDLGITHGMTDDEIEEQAQDLVGEADGVLDVDDVEAHLRELMEGLDAVASACPEIDDVFYSAQWSACVDLTLGDITVSIGVGVPDAHRGTAQATGCADGLIDIWPLGTHWAEAPSEALWNAVYQAVSANALYTRLHVMIDEEAAKLAKRRSQDANHYR